jgi:hypothetical protein
MSRPSVHWLSLFGVVLALSAVRPARAADPRHLFAKAATVAIDRRGPGALVRLTLPTEVLAACRADLSDLRLFDVRGQETAFVLDRGAPPPAAPTKLKSVAAPALAAEHHETPRAGAAPLLEESYELASPPAAPKGGSWELVLEVASPHFVRRLDLHALNADGQRVELKVNESVFRLEDKHGERLRVPLPSVPGARLRVKLVGEASAPLEPRFRFEAVEKVESAPVAAVELLPVDVSTLVGRTVVQLSRPPGLVPSGLRLETTTSAFSRAITVRDSGGASVGATVGSASVFRIQGLSLFESLDLPLEPARGKVLEVSIDDGDSQPLSALKFSALVRAPSLVFSLPATSEPAPAPTLYFGGGRAHAPRYDLATLVPDSGNDSDRAHAAHSLFDPAQLSLASLREIRENPEFDRAPALGFAQHAGAAIDSRVYSHSRRVELVPSPDGVTEIPLTAQDLSLLRADLGDVRVVDGSGRQWPFLLQEARREELVGAKLLSLGREGRSSRNEIPLPFTPLALNALVLDVTDTYFDRAFKLEAELPDGSKLELKSGRLTRAVEGARLALVLEFPLTRVRALQLSVEDGDNAPLAISTVRARVPVPSLLVVAERGSYQLLLGNPAAEPASYDIESARSLVLSVATQQSIPLGLEANPAYRAASRLAAGDGPERLALWGALGAAVLILGVMTFRLVRRESEDRNQA